MRQCNGWWRRRWKRCADVQEQRGEAAQAIARYYDMPLDEALAASDLSHDTWSARPVVADGLENSLRSCDLPNALPLDRVVDPALRGRRTLATAHQRRAPYSTQPER